MKGVKGIIVDDVCVVLRCEVWAVILVRGEGRGKNGGLILLGVGWGTAGDE